MNTRFVIILISVIALALIVMQAIQANSLLPLLAGVVLAMAVIVLALRAVSTPVVKIAESMRMSRADDYRHREAMAKYNVLFVGRNYEPLPVAEQAPAQIEAPKPADDGSQIQFNPNYLKTSAANLLLYSIRLLGEESNRIASGPECAKGNIRGYNARTWSKMIHEYLEPQYGVVSSPGSTQNGGGVYVPDSIGNIGNLYHIVVGDTAVDSLPENKR